MTKPIQLPINGILLLDKPLHLTSNGALQRVKRLFRAKKAGHTGSLDPLATGMLPLCFGEATKLSQFLLDSDKYYRVTAVLGTRTTTGDTEGEVLAAQPVPAFDQDKLGALFKQFTGTIQQVPPMYSALKFQGKPLYKLARQGIEIERQPREVHIYSLCLIAMTETSFTLDVHCSKGTYIRTLIDDMGLVLGCGAHVGELRRTAVAPYQAGVSYTIEALEAVAEQGGHAALAQCLLPLESCMQSYPAVKLSTAAEFYLKSGQPVMASHIKAPGPVRLLSQDGKFLGIGEMLDDGRVAPRRLFNLSLEMAEAV